MVVWAADAFFLNQLDQGKSRQGWVHKGSI
jgi:hypothetical protein